MATLEITMATVEITVERLEKFIEAEVKLGLIKKMIEQENYVSACDLKRMVGMEIKNNDIG